MAKKRKTTLQKKKKKVQIGKLPPMHTFFLNPYTDARFTRCPKCDAHTKVRKKPFVIHIDPGVILNLNMSGRYCPDCDLMILHQDVVEDLLVRTFSLYNPDIIGNDYLIIGTLERKAWRKISQESGTPGDVFEHMHDFKQVVKFEPEHYGWLPDPVKQNKTD